MGEDYGFMQRLGCQARLQHGGEFNEVIGFSHGLRWSMQGAAALDPK